MDTTARQLKDEWLALRCRGGDPEGFAELAREMERPLLYYVTKLMNDQGRALDVLQEVWVTAFRSVRRLEDPRSLRPWLYRIAHGLVVDRIRQDLARERAEKAWIESADSGEESTFAAEDAGEIHRGLDELDIKHREVLVLYFLEDLSVAEIASIVGCPEGTVKSRLHHAKRLLKEALLRNGYGTLES